MPSSPAILFDRRAVRQHRRRALRAPAAEFLYQDIVEKLAERLDEMAPRSYPTALALATRGAFPAEIARVRPMDAAIALEPAATPGCGVVGDPDLLPLADASLDLAVALPFLHWVDDLPGTFVQLRRALRPDGILLGAMFGGETLGELRLALTEAELAEESGAGPRVSPFTSLRDLGHLLQRAGFALPVVDSERVTVTYDNAFALMRDLRAMGETNALVERRRGFSRRATLARAASIYADQFRRADGRIPATFEILYFAGWAPHPSQPKALRPGSAAARLADALGTVERKTE
jgi:NADH dehydrogenase [ubiquinone] 1 alpha subcomplex assembly factor 5